MFCGIGPTQDTVMFCGIGPSQDTVMFCGIGPSQNTVMFCGAGPVVSQQAATIHNTHIAGSRLSTKSVIKTEVTRYWLTI